VGNPIEYGGTPGPVKPGQDTTRKISKPEDRIFRASADASYADDEETRYSSQGYITTLFGGPISWQATKQKTITTSTTEAELLALGEVVKEGLAINRLFRQLSFEPDHDLTIECDNEQTIRIVTSAADRLKTKMKHVDVHSLWQRQEYNKGAFKVEYVPTGRMLADGLTKSLPGQKQQHWVDLIGLTDIKTLIDSN
jgi:antitoxin component of MazEF toxin-antitoxin module